MYSPYHRKKEEGTTREVLRGGQKGRSCWGEKSLRAWPGPSPAREGIKIRRGGTVLIEKGGEDFRRGGRT